MLRGVVIVVLLALNLMLWGTLIFLGGLLKLPCRGRVRRRIIAFLAGLGERWIIGNQWIFDRFLDVDWDIRVPEELSRDGHYLFICNHVSWIDVFALQHAFRGHAPFIRFFMKRILLFFPIAGQACWAIEFPFVRRYSAAYLAQHPEKRGLDLETTRIACRRYRASPFVMLNFCEGTRFTREKHEDQQSPFTNLLRPRIGGIGFVLASLAGQLDAVIDVTLIYPSLEVTMWDFVTNRVPRVVVLARRLNVPPEFHDGAITEPGPARDRFRSWVERIWHEKDATIGGISPGGGTGLEPGDPTLAQP